MLIMQQSCVPSLSKQDGLTLIELLFAMALSVALLASITHVFIEAKNNYAQDEELARLHENSSFVLDIFKRELRMAGFFAGIEASSIKNATATIGGDCRPGWVFDTSKPVDFLDNPIKVKKSALGDSFAGCLKKPKLIQPNTDVISIKRTAGIPTISGGIYADTGSLSGNKKSNSFYLKTDTAENPSFEYVGSAFPVEISNSSTASMWLYQPRIWYVRNYSVVSGDGIPTLTMVWLQGNQLVEAALVEGVEALQIEFGIPASVASDVPVLFVSNPDYQQMAAATVARIYLLMRTRNALHSYEDKKVYRLGALPPLSPGGNYIRRVFMATIKIRSL